MKRIRMDTLLMITAVIVLVAYIAYEAYSVTHVQLQFETAVLSTVYEKIDTKALVIRDEKPIANAASGITVPTLSDGDKINVGGNVAMNFSTEDAASAYAKYHELQEQLRYYEDLEAKTLGQAASVESINSEIDTRVDEYIRALDSSDGTKISKASENANDALLRRQMIIGESVDLVSIIQDLRQQSEAVADAAMPDSYITTEQSGVFSSYTDGYETLWDYAAAEGMTPEQIEDAINTVTAGEQPESSNLGKLITSYAWYLACAVDADEVLSLKNGSKINVALKDSDDTVLTCQIVSGADVQPGQEKTALILKCSSMDSKLANLRCEDIEIRIKEYEGIKVPASALHVDGDKKGVYALVSSQVSFREAEVIYSQDDFVMLAFDQSNPDGIRLYDKIITQGKELEDGRVFT
ncbi:MAG: hypothetical protein IJ168_00940 [Eubacterium sp.]|nr:hypothetical protein [Eubacterium sp.]